MFCGKCGASVSETAKFCMACGNPVPPIQPEASPDPIVQEAPAAPPASAPVKRSKKKLVIWLIIAALILAAGATTGCLLLRKNTPRKVAYAAMDAIFEPDAGALFDLIPKQVLEEEFGGRLGQKTAKAQLQENLEDMLSDYHRYYEDPEIEYNVVDVHKLPDSVLEELQEVYEDEFDCQITDAREVIVHLVITDDDDAYYSSVDMLTLVKVDGKWYLDYRFLIALC